MSSVLMTDLVLSVICLYKCGYDKNQLSRNSSYGKDGIFYTYFNKDASVVREQRVAWEA